MPYIDIQEDEELRQLMYNNCLHWCSSIGDSLKDTILQVNVGQIDHTQNIFYRTIISG